MNVRDSPRNASVAEWILSTYEQKKMENVEYKVKFSSHLLILRVRKRGFFTSAYDIFFNSGEQRIMRRAIPDIFLNLPYVIIYKENYVFNLLHKKLAHTAGSSTCKHVKVYKRNRSLTTVLAMLALVQSANLSWIDEITCFLDEQ